MGYSIHIQRECKSEISLDDWVELVQATEGLRLSTTDIEVRNPMTGELVAVRRKPRDTEVYFPDKKQWVCCLYFPGSRISFDAIEFADPISPVLKAAILLAKELNAIVIGDEGERYG